MTTPPPAEPGGPAALTRFDRAERVAHWVTAGLVVTLAATGAALSSGTLMALVGRRRAVELVHLAAGLALPLPVLVGLAGRGLRADLGRLNRWSSDDVAWLRAALHAAAERRRRHAGLVVGKFNAGQKLNAAFTAGAGLVMLGTGVIMYWFHPWPLAWRSGATTTHDWLALAVVVVAAGHVRFALRDPEALRSMRTGRIGRDWAARHAPGWLAEQPRPGEAATAQPAAAEPAAAEP
ncbi:MAG TPA: cytochrome b/b6 domain-containing protein [Acidimicrobiales bacterium]|nr:cytochrome b/b6 domain-containing protein [Acidimicrobiales bacterium]